MSEDDDVMLTTTDNPYNPFTQFDEWRGFDEQNGYFTLSYLSRVAFTSNELSEADETRAILEAMDEIVKENITNSYIKVFKSSFKPRVSLLNS